MITFDELFAPTGPDSVYVTLVSNQPGGVVGYASGLVQRTSAKNPLSEAGIEYAGALEQLFSDRTTTAPPILDIPGTQPFSAKVADKIDLRFAWRRLRPGHRKDPGRHSQVSEVPRGARAA